MMLHEPKVGGAGGTVLQEPKVGCVTGTSLIHLSRKQDAKEESRKHEKKDADPIHHGSDDLGLHGPSVHIAITGRLSMLLSSFAKPNRPGERERRLPSISIVAVT